MRKFLLLVLCAVFLIIADLASAAAPGNSPTSTLTHDELTSKIQEKTRQLDDVSRQLEATKQNLRAAKDERRTLQRELHVLDGNVAQLNLNLKADELNVQKLNLEIDSLHAELGDIGQTIEDKRAAIEKLIFQVYVGERFNGNLLRVFLASKSFADGVFELQAFKNLEQRLVADVANLRNLQAEYNEKIALANAKKSEVDFHKKNLENRRNIIQEEKKERALVLAETKNKETVFERQVAELEKTQQQIANEVEALDSILRTKIDPALLPRPGAGVLAMPIDTDKSSITQDYGATQFARYGYKGKWHNGIDIAASLGTPVRAAEDGTVAAVGNQDAYCRRGAYGKFIVLAHQNNLATLYAHLSRYVVQKGETVKRGQVVGYAGRTGYATGPHLHFTVYAGPTFYIGPSRTCGQMPYGGDLNPLSYL